MSPSRGPRRIFRAKHESHYTVIRNATIRDKRLSWKATGVLCYLLSMPDHWEVRVSDFRHRKSEGGDTFRSGMKELEKFGYVQRQKKRNPANGQFRTLVRVYETPEPATAPSVRKGP